MSNYDARCFCSCCCDFPERDDEARMECTCKQRRSSFDSSMSVAKLIGALRVLAPEKVAAVEDAMRAVLL